MTNPGAAATSRDLTGATKRTVLLVRLVGLVKAPIRRDKKGVARPLTSPRAVPAPYGTTPIPVRDRGRGSDD